MASLAACRVALRRLAAPPPFSHGLGSGYARAAVTQPFHPKISAPHQLTITHAETRVRIDAEDDIEDSWDVRARRRRPPDCGVPVYGERVPIADGRGTLSVEVAAPSGGQRGCVRPGLQVDPHCITVLQELGIDMSGARNKSVTELEVLCGGQAPALVVSSRDSNGQRSRAVLSPRHVARTAGDDR